MIALNPRVAWVDHGETIWLLDLGAADPTPIALTGSGAALWRLLPCASASELAGRVALDFEVAEEAVAGDVDEFVESLVRQGLLQVA